MRLCLCVVSSLLAACGGPLKPSTAPLDASFQVQARIDGRDLRMLLDTGAEITSFYSDAASRLGLDVGPVGDKRVLLTDSSDVERELRDFVRDARFHLGAMECYGDAILCMPRAGQPGASDAGVAVASANAHDGIMGMDLLGQLVLWFDAPSGELHVLSEDTADAFVAKRGREIAQRLKWTGGSRPHVRVTLEGSREVELLLDTGADNTSIPPGSAAALELPSGVTLERERREREAADFVAAIEEAGGTVTNLTVHDPDGSSVGVHGIASGPRAVHHLRSLRLGDREVADLVVVEQEDPLLGRDVLAGFDWILHGPRKELWLMAKE